MDNLAVSRAPLREQAVVLRDRHTWVMSFLYIGTFGQLHRLLRGAAAADQDASFPRCTGVLFAALGPLVGSVARPVGGWLSDRIGGARVTAGDLRRHGRSVWSRCWPACGAGSFAPFLGAFLLLFVASGVGNGSTYRMIPAIFRGQASGPGVTEPTRADDRGCSGHRLASRSARSAASSSRAGSACRSRNTGSIDAALLVFLAGYARLRAP